MATSAQVLSITAEEKIRSCDIVNTAISPSETLFSVPFKVKCFLHSIVLLICSAADTKAIQNILLVREAEIVTPAVTGTPTCLRLAAHMLWYSWTDSGPQRDYVPFEVKNFRYFWNPKLILNSFLLIFVSFICSSELRGWYQKMPGTDMVTKAPEYVNKFNTSEGFCRSSTEFVTANTENFPHPLTLNQNISAVYLAW